MGIEFDAGIKLAIPVIFELFLAIFLVLFGPYVTLGFWIGFAFGHFRAKFGPHGSLLWVTLSVKLVSRHKITSYNDLIYF